jgi:hypothetical protein
VHRRSTLASQTDVLNRKDLKAKLANSTEAELKSLQSSLRQSKEDTTADLQKNVFKKYVHLEALVAPC